MFDLLSVTIATGQNQRLPEALLENNIAVKLEPMAPVHPGTFPWHDGRYGCMVDHGTFDYRAAHTGGAYFGPLSNKVYKGGIELMIQGSDKPEKRVEVAAAHPGYDLCVELDGMTKEQIEMVRRISP